MTAQEAAAESKKCITAPLMQRQHHAPGAEDELRRLAVERAALVATGIYGDGDALIRQLDARMRELHAGL